MSRQANDLGRLCGRAYAQRGPGFEKEALFQWVTESRPWRTIADASRTVGNIVEGAAKGLGYGALHDLANLGAMITHPFGKNRLNDWLYHAAQDMGDLSRAGHAQLWSTIFGPQAGVKVMDWIGKHALVPYSEYYAGTSKLRPSAEFRRENERRLDPRLLRRLADPRLLRRLAANPQIRNDFQELLSSGGLTEAIRKAQQKHRGLVGRPLMSLADIVFDWTPYVIGGPVSAGLLRATLPSFADSLLNVADAGIRALPEVWSAASRRFFGTGPSHGTV